MNADAKQQRLRGPRLRALAAFAAPVAIAILPAGAQAALITPHAATPQQVTPHVAEPPAPAPAPAPAPSAPTQAVGEGDPQPTTTSQPTPSRPTGRPPAETDQESYDRGVRQKAKAEQDAADARQDQIEQDEFDRWMKADADATMTEVWNQVRLDTAVEEAVEQVKAIVRSIFGPIPGTEPTDDGMTPTSRDESSSTDNTSKPDGDSSSGPADSSDSATSGNDIGGGSNGNRYRRDAEDETERAD